MTIEVSGDWYQYFFGTEWLDLATQQFPLERTQAQVEFIVERSGLEPGAAILDLCCGHGRHSVELARRGYRVVGLVSARPRLISPAWPLPARTSPSSSSRATCATSHTRTSSVS
jgi:SAM-dependent methyltransferase